MTRMSRRRFLMATVAAVSTYGPARGYTYETTELADSALPSDAAAVLVTDLHVHGKVPEWVVENVRSIRPDILLVAGDSWDELSPWPPLAAVRALKMLAAASREAYAVLGNHEYAAARSRGDPVEVSRRLYGEAGIRLLVDEAVDTSVGVRLCGVDWRKDPRDYSGLPILGREHVCDIVLAHSPDVFHYSDSGRDVLYLAGHTHGGQVCLPGSASIVTNSKFGYRWGLYRHGRARMYVSRGLGEMLPPRLFCPRQLLVVRGS